jgi:hypothetical protein
MRPATAALWGQREVRAGNLKQIDEVRSGEAISPNQIAAHFGLDKNGKVDQLVVYWPSGMHDRQ